MTTDAEKMSIIARLDRAIELKNQTGQPAKGAPMPYVRAVETATAAGIIGYYEGRTGRRTLPGGVPLDVSVAAAGFGLGFLGLGGVGAEHAYAIGTAGLAVCAYNWGKQMGERMSGSTLATAPVRAETGARRLTVSIWECRAETWTCHAETTSLRAQPQRRRLEATRSGSSFLRPRALNP